MSTEKYEVIGTVTVPALTTEPLTYYNWFKDIQHKDKALHRKSKLIKRLRDENAELEKENERLRRSMLRGDFGNNWEPPKDVTLEQLNRAVSELLKSRAEFIYDDKGEIIGARG